MGIALPQLAPASEDRVSGAQVIDGSLKFVSGSSDHLIRTPSSAGNRKTWTWSGWVKRSKIERCVLFCGSAAGGNTVGTVLRFSYQDQQVELYDYVGGYTFQTYSEAFLRDPSAWYHIVVAFDTTQSTNTDRVKFYINGALQTNATSGYNGASTYPTQNADCGVSNNTPQLLGMGWFADAISTSQQYDGSMSQVYLIDGQALDASYFGYTDPLTNTWRPKKYEGTFGTNGFYLPLDGNSPIGQDKSGNGNNWTAVNFSGTSNDPDVVKDSPSGAVSGGRAQTGITTTSSAPSNYATMNPLQMSPNRTPTISDGNLSISLSSGTSEWTNTGCTMNIGSGKYYWEVQFTTINGTIARIGVADSNNYEFNRNTASSGLPWLGSGTGVSWSLDVGGNTYYNGSTVNASYTSTIITSDIIGVLLDLDNNTLSFSKNGTNLGVAHSNVTSDFVTPGFGLHGATTNTINVNFGQKPFKYAPPQGFLPLNSASATSETVITRPDQYVGATIYTGNGGTQSINVGLKPDFVWIKAREASVNHILWDTLRGSPGDYDRLESSSTASSSGNANLGLTAFNSNGFTVVDNSAGDYQVNGSAGGANSGTNGKYVAWSWKAGGNKNTFNVDDVGYASAAAAGLDGGSLAVTGASVGTKQGFSIIKFASGSSGNKTLSHGLLETPTFILVKTTGASSDWSVYHKDLGGTVNNYLVLNTNAANATASNIWGAAVPTSSVFGINPGTTCATSQDVIAYLWHDIPGTVQRKVRHSTNCPQDSADPPVASYSRCIQDTRGMTATHKLIFVASFFWMMNWGVRVTSVLLDKF